MAAELVFYTHPMSRGRIVRWMLEELGIAYRTELLELGSAMKAPDYLAINPMGKVPAVVHGDQVLTETAAICVYLADVFPDAGLAPPIEQRGDYYRWLFFAAGPFEAAIANRGLGFEVPQENQRSIGYGSFDLVVDTLERIVASRPFIAGESFSAADVYVGSQIGFGLQFGMIDKRAGFEGYWERLSMRDAYLRAQEIDAAAAESMTQDSRL